MSLKTVLQNNLREDESRVAYNKMQIESLQNSLNSSNKKELERQIRGFEQDNELHLKRIAEYRKQIAEI